MVMLTVNPMAYQMTLAKMMNKMASQMTSMRERMAVSGTKNPRIMKMIMKMMRMEPTRNLKTWKTM